MSEMSGDHDSNSTSPSADPPTCKSLPPVDAASEALPLAAPRAGDVPEKTVLWPNSVSVGDCNISSMSLTLSADGHAEFAASISGGDDDCWVFYGGISLLDNHGVVLWTSGKLVGPTMWGEGTGGSWDEGFFYPAMWFDTFNSARINQMHC
jgi:hypothetical protein